MVCTAHIIDIFSPGRIGPKNRVWWTIKGAPVNMPIVMKGSSGNAVKIVQNVLKINGYYFGSIDGFFGTMTDVAVRQLQISKALPQDRIVGDISWHALSKLPH